MMPKVSVVIPVYNVEKYLGECLDSVLGQTLKDIEVICVDDGSTDSSSKVLAEYAMKDSRIKIIAQPNAGPGPARNRALDVAVGECIVFIDPDDKYPDDDVLSTLYNALMSSTCAIVGGHAFCFPEDDPIVAERNRKSNRECAFPHLGIVDFADYQVPYRYWRYMYKRELLSDIRFPNLRIFQDPPFFLHVMAKARRFVAIDKVVYAYRQHEANATSLLTRSPLKRKARLRGLGLLITESRKHGFSRVFTSTCKKVEWQIARNQITWWATLTSLGMGAAFELISWRLLRRVKFVFSKKSWRGLRLRRPAFGYAAMRRRKSLSVFLLRAWNSIFNGLFVSKLRRHLLKIDLVWRSVVGSAMRKPIAPRKVIFCTFAASCSCNPKYIAKALSASHPDVDIVWILGNAQYRSCNGKMEFGRAVPMWTPRALREVATAKVLTENAQFLLMKGMPPKREGQRWINTWHGSLGIKRLDTASASIRSKIPLMRAYDAVLVNSDFEEDVFRKSYFHNNKLLRFGHPRNDVFFLPESEKSAIRSKVKKALGVADDVHLAIYAPTFREDSFVTFARILSFDKWEDALTSRFGGQWRIAVRLHPHDARAMTDGLFSLPPRVLNASFYDDMQELMLAGDIGITDYSSWIYDFVLGGSPGFIFAPDLAEYDQSRGFYYPLSETPFPVAEAEDTLCANIRAFDAEKYAADRSTFLAARGCMEDGHAAERAAEFIYGLISEKEQ